MSKSANQYHILGVPLRATAEEIRQAYRLLARKYHPDMNLGKRGDKSKGDQTDATFQRIHEAYKILIDPKSRKQHDSDLARRLKRQEAPNSFYSSKTQAAAVNPNLNQKKPTGPQKASPLPPRTAAGTTRPVTKPPTNFSSLSNPLARAIKNMTDSALRYVSPKLAVPLSRKSEARSLAIIEVPVTMQEAIYGSKKSIEVQDGGSKRKVAVRIPTGVGTGSVVHLKSRQSPYEEMVVVIRVIYHPILSVRGKDLIVELPLSIQEAYLGCSLTVPTLDDATIIKIEPHSQSGDEVRLKSRGAPQSKGDRGDLVYRLMLKLPQNDDRANLASIEQLPVGNVRKNFPTKLL